MTEQGEAQSPSPLEVCAADVSAGSEPAPLGGDSLLSYAPALVVLAIVIADCGRFADTDLWGHIYFGNAMLRSGHLIAHDPYSYSAAGRTWLHHEWLSEAALAGGYDAFGAIGLKLLKLACTAATMFFVAAAIGETGAPVMIQFAVLMADALALIAQMQFRPQLFTFALMAALMAGLTRDNYGRRGLLWLAVPGLALWANLHGGFFIGLVSLAVYTGMRGLIDLMAGRGMKRARELATITAAGALATFATPTPIGTWDTVLHSLNNPMTRQVMADWRPLMTVVAGQMHEAHSGLVFVGIVLTLFGCFVVSFGRAPRGGDLPLAAIAMLMIAAAFLSVRNMALGVIAVSAPLARHAALALGSAARSDEARAPGTNPASRLSPLSQGVIAILALTFAIESGLFSRRIPAAAHYPSGAVAFMRAHSLHGNILNNFAWGQYLIWHTEPESRVFIDGRFDLVYPPEVITGYLDFFEARADGGRLLDRYQHDFVLIPPTAPAFLLVARRTDWKLLYRDRDAALFARAASSAARVPTEMVRGEAERRSYFP
jgi:hypothetical protein